MGVHINCKVGDGIYPVLLCTICNDGTRAGGRGRRDAEVVMVLGLVDRRGKVGYGQMGAELKITLWLDGFEGKELR